MKFEQLTLDFTDEIFDEAKTKFSKTLKNLTDKKIDNSKIIAQLLKNAESLENQASKINTDVSGNWTYRRQRFADNAALKKDALIKAALVLKRIAEQWENGIIDERLKNIRNASDFSTIYYPRPVEPDDGWYKDEYPKMLKRATKLGLTCKEDEEPLRKLIFELGEFRLSDEEKRRNNIKKKINLLRQANIPGFFPTPDELIMKMIDLVKLDITDKILEPSAGIGSIVDIIHNKGLSVRVDCVERQSSLREILELKGYPLVEYDIFDYYPENKYDVIIMNPPFEKSEDIDHVLHCFNNCLVDGGQLVSIMSAGVKNNTSKKHQSFRDFVDDHGGIFYSNGQAFKEAFNSTSVSTVTLHLIK